MPKIYTDFATKFDAIAERCQPQAFLQLSTTSKDFITVATWLRDIEDRSEFERAFSRFMGLLVRFYAALQQANDMGLLASVDQTTRSSPRELRELDRALEYPERRISCLLAVCQLALATASFIGIRRFPTYYFPWTQMFVLLFDQPALAGIFKGVDLTSWQSIKKSPANGSPKWRRRLDFFRYALDRVAAALLMMLVSCGATALYTGLKVTN